MENSGEEAPELTRAEQCQEKAVEIIQEYQKFGCRFIDNANYYYYEGYRVGKTREQIILITSDYPYECLSEEESEVVRQILSSLEVELNKNLIAPEDGFGATVELTHQRNPDIQDATKIL